MADDFLLYVPGIPMESDDFGSNLEVWNEIRDSRKKYQKTLEILDNIKCLTIVKNDETINLDRTIQRIKDATEEVKIKEATIQPMYPGIEIYSEERLGSLFSIESLFVDSFSVRSEVRELYFGRTSELLSALRGHMNFKVNDPGLSQFLFFVMSLHKDKRLVETCYIYLTDAMNSFKPTLNDIFAVFANWGCSTDLLYPQSCDRVFETPEPLRYVTSGHVEGSNMNHNLESVLSYLEYWTAGADERKFLIRILLLSSLEKKFRLLSCKFYECIHALLNQNKWSPEEISPLVELLHFKDLHYHNQAQASVHLRGGSEFASQVSISLAFAILQQLLDHTEIKYLQKVDGSCISQLNLNDIGNKCCYDIYIIVWLLKLCTTNMQQGIANKDCLKKITTSLKCLKRGLLKDSTECDPHILLEFIGRMFDC